MTSKQLPRLTKHVSYQNASTAGNGSCPNLGHASAKYMKEHTAKRPRWCENQEIQAKSSARAGLFKRCSSKLSTVTLPRDILSEISSYLHPSDLVSLNCMNRDFRSLLSSRSSSVIWNTCFKLCGAPASPADVSPREWAHLLFGDAYCFSCGAKPENNILFSSRRRACKSCMAAHLLCSSHVPRGFRDMIRFELGTAGSMVHQQMPCCTRHWWDDDVAAFEAEMKALKYSVGASDGGVVDGRLNFLAFLTRKKEDVKAIREHALVCAEWEKDRNASRSPKPSYARVKRLKDTRAPFLQHGYSESAVDQLRWQREVGVASGKPMSNRVWQRVEPLDRPGDNEVRDRCVDMQANSYWQDQVALLDAGARSSYQLPTGSRHEDGRLIHGHSESDMQVGTQDQIPRLDAPGYQLAGGRALQGTGGPDYDHSRGFTPANSQDHVTQLDGYHSPIGSAPEAPASQYSTLANALSLSVTPTQSRDSDDQVDAQPDEATASISHGCPICNRTFTRQQERNRHVESYLPHSIYCPHQGCPWTGRRQWDFKEHWKKGHPNSGRVPIKTNEIYDSIKFVKSIVDGTPPVEVVQSVCLMVQERLEKLGKVGVGVNVWGRRRKVVN